VSARDRDAFFERIKVKLQLLEERKEKAKEEWALRGCSFQPQINRPSRHRQQHTAGGLPFHERLYNQVRVARLSWRSNCTILAPVVPF
jgi:hypothetical protein